MEFLTISTYSEISLSNYQIINTLIQDPLTPLHFKYELITLLKDHSSKAESPPISIIISSNLLLTLINLKTHLVLDEKNTLNILWILTNVLSGSKSDLNYVIEIKGVEFLLSHLPNDNKEIMHQTVWGLSNIAGDSPFYRDMILEYNILDIVFNTFEEENNLPIIKTLVWFVSNIARGHPLVNHSKIKPVFKFLKHCYYFCGDPDILLDFLWAISYISETGVESIVEIINTNLIQQLTNDYLIQITKQHNLLTPYIRNLANMVSGDNFSTSFVINLGILDGLKNLLNHSKPIIRKEIAFLFSNIAAGTEEQVLSLLNVEGLLKLVGERLIEDEVNVKHECVWILCNLLSSLFMSELLAQKLIESGVMFALLQTKMIQKPEIQDIIREAFNDYWNLLKNQGKDQDLKLFRIGLQAFIEKTEFTNNLKVLKDLLKENPLEEDLKDFNEPLEDINDIKNSINGFKIED